ncbi:hypothetical protein BH23BAC1_BH23BAC1_17590 [soil metagenome]
MRFIFLIFLYFSFNESLASSITFYNLSAEVWSPDQAISGEIEGFTTESVTVFLNESSFMVEVNNLEFMFDLKLRNSNNKIWVEAQDGSLKVVSDTLLQPG